MSDSDRFLGIYISANPGWDCEPGCPTYYCPQGKTIECPKHGGFDVCCIAPHLHRHDPVTGVQADLVRDFMLWLLNESAETEDERRPAIADLMAERFMDYVRSKR